MCHFVLLFCVIIYVVLKVNVGGGCHVRVSVKVDVLELVPARIGRCLVDVVDFIHQLGLYLSVVGIGRSGAVLLEYRTHGAVAFAGRMDVLDGDCEGDGVVYHVSHIDIRIAVGYLHILVGVIAIVVAVFDNYMISGVDRKNKVVKTTVARYRYLAGQGEMHVVVVIFVLDSEMHFDIGIAHIVVLHVDKKLLTYLVVNLLDSYRHAFERQFIFSKLTHNVCQLAKNFAKVAKFFQFINFFRKYFLGAA